jgi:uncharacterized protein YndB with AHSA1/START domain
MRRSRAVSVQIARPFDEVYRFLAEPSNFPTWGPVEDGAITHLGGRDYLMKMVGSEVVLRFIEPNRYGVLDYWSFRPDTEPGPATSVRLVPNEEGSEVTVLWLQQEGEDDAKFNSEVDWLMADLGVLKSLLEA